MTRLGRGILSGSTPRPFKGTPLLRKWRSSLNPNTTFSPFLIELLQLITVYTLFCSLSALFCRSMHLFGIAYFLFMQWKQLI